MPMADFSVEMAHACEDHGHIMPSAASITQSPGWIRRDELLLSLLPGSLIQAIPEGEERVCGSDSALRGQAMLSAFRAKAGGVHPANLFILCQWSDSQWHRPGIDLTYFAIFQAKRRARAQSL